MGVPEPFSVARGAVQPSPGAGSKPKPLTLVCLPGPWGGSSSGRVASLCPRPGADLSLIPDGSL